VKVKCVGYWESPRETRISNLEHLYELFFVAEKNHAPILTWNALYLGYNPPGRISEITMAVPSGTAVIADDLWSIASTLSARTASWSDHAAHGLAMGIYVHGN
jgi:hypothetical protein